MAQQVVRTGLLAARFGGKYENGRVWSEVALNLGGQTRGLFGGGPFDVGVTRFLWMWLVAFRVTFLRSCEIPSAMASLVSVFSAVTRPFVTHRFVSRTLWLALARSGCGSLVCDLSVSALSVGALSFVSRWSVTCWLVIPPSVTGGL